MKTRWLFPHCYRLLGWLIFVPALVAGLGAMYADFEVNWLSVSGWLFQNAFGNSTNNLTDELAGTGIIIGLMLIAFSREKVDDEMIGQMRLESLQWSIYANYLILIIALFTVYDLAFLNVMVYNMFTTLLVFIGRFRWLIYRNNHRMAI